MSDDRIYPCNECGVMRTAAEGGTIFTCCTDCWNKHYAASRVVAGGGLPTVLDLNLDDSLKADPVLVLLQTENDELKQRISSLEHALSAVQADSNRVLEEKRKLERERDALQVRAWCAEDPIGGKPTKLAEHLNWLTRENERLEKECREIDVAFKTWRSGAAEDLTAVTIERDLALAQLAEARGECERMRPVYEATLEWHDWHQNPDPAVAHDAYCRLMSAIAARNNGKEGK